MRRVRRLDDRKATMKYSHPFLVVMIDRLEGLKSLDS